MYSIAVSVVRTTEKSNHRERETIASATAYEAPDWDGLLAAINAAKRQLAECMNVALDSCDESTLSGRLGGRRGKTSA